MPYNGSGSFTVDASYFPAVSGALIESAKYNGALNDIATALSSTVTKDGQQTITANLPMAGYRHTGVGDAVTRTDYAALGQVQDSTALWAGTATGTANAITLTLTPAITAYLAGQSFTYKSSASANTSTMTVAINGLTAKAIQKNGAAMASGDHAASKWFRITYDGAAFQLEQIFQPSAFMLTVMDDTTAAAARTTLGAFGSVGTATNDSAAAGSVGEYISSTVLVGSAVSLVTSISKNITSISLTAGDWDVGGNVMFVYGVTTSVNQVQGSISQTTGVMDEYVKFSLPVSAYVPGSRAPIAFTVPGLRISLTSTTTVYLLGYAEFTVSTMSGYGTIWARRAR